MVYILTGSWLLTCKFSSGSCPVLMNNFCIWTQAFCFSNPSTFSHIHESKQ